MKKILAFILASIFFISAFGIHATEQLKEPEVEINAPETEIIDKYFQSDNNLEVDGRAGPATLKALCT